MPQGTRGTAAPSRIIGDVLAEVTATDGVRREQRLRLFEAVTALADSQASEAELALAWRAARAVHAFEFAMIHSAAPDRIYARKALKSAQTAWTKNWAAFRESWDGRPRDLAA